MSVPPLRVTYASLRQRDLAIAAAAGVAPGIDPRAVVAASAEIGADVTIGAYAVVGPDVVLGRGTILMPHAVVQGVTRLGEGNVVHSFAVLGGAPQSHRVPAADTAFNRGVGELTTGDFNEFREHVTVHTGTTTTTLGSYNLLMVAAHLAHDVHLGSHCALANGVQIAGHVIIEDHVTFGGLAAVAQRLRVGESAFVAGGAMCERDVPPYVIVQGDRARIRTLNRVGLVRRGISNESLANLRAVFRAYRERTLLTREMIGSCTYSAKLAAALQLRIEA